MVGGVRKRCVIAGAAGVLGLVLQLTAASAAPNSRLAVVVSPGLNTATLSWRGSGAGQATVELGTSRAYGLTLTTKSNSATLRSLAPQTTYYYRVEVAGSSITDAVGSFTTDSIGGRATLERRGNRTLLDGVPYAPLMVEGGPCMATEDLVQGALSLGATALDDQLQFSKATGTYRDTCSDSSTVAALRDLLAGRLWYFSSNTTVQASLADFPSALLGSPQIEFTLNDSPIGRKCGPANSDVCYFDSMSAFATRAPVMATVVLHTGPAFPPVNPTRVNFDFWEVFAAGGVGVTYYAKGPNLTFSIASPLLAQQARANAARLATLEPAIFGGITRAVPNDRATAIRARAWEYGGTTYVLAVNASAKAQVATLHIGNAARRSTVLWESRSRAIRSGAISDSFGSYGVHIYKIVDPS